jgi:cell division protein FtsB
MDFRVNRLAKLGALFHPEVQFRALLNRAPQAEAWLQRLAAKISPTVVAVYGARRRIATAAVVVITISLFIHVMFGANGMVVYRQKKTEYQQLKQEIDALQKENNQSTGRINSLQNDSQALEKEAREQLHYARPGEVVYVSPAPTQSAPEQDHRSAQKGK